MLSKLQEWKRESPEVVRFLTENYRTSGMEPESISRLTRLPIITFLCMKRMFQYGFEDIAEACTSKVLYTFVRLLAMLWSVITNDLLAQSHDLPFQTANAQEQYQYFAIRLLLDSLSLWINCILSNSEYYVIFLDCVQTYNYNPALPALLLMNAVLDSPSLVDVDDEVEPMRKKPADFEPCSLTFNLEELLSNPKLCCLSKESILRKRLGIKQSQRTEPLGLLCWNQQESIHPKIVEELFRHYFEVYPACVACHSSSLSWKDAKCTIQLGQRR
jgi:hypothetical protein